MSTREEAADPTSVVRARVKELRRRKGWTAAELGEKLTSRGVPWNRAIVTNFELGRRPAVSVQELMALALVLDVAPVNLLIPLDSEPYQITPSGTEVQSSGEAWRWIRGDWPRPGASPAEARIYFAEAPTQIGRGEYDPDSGLYEWYEKVERGGDDGQRL